MMKLVVDPDPILKQTAVAWDFEVDVNAEAVEREMVDIMESFNGIGLAANQVGLLKRVFVIQLQKHTELTEPFAMFNPEVLSKSTQEQNGEEGCLSFPNLWLDIKRSQAIDVKYLDKLGKECKISLTSIDARCFLHELDHLNGEVFTNKVSQLKLIFAKKQQRKRNGRTK